MRNDQHVKHQVASNGSFTRAGSFWIVYRAYQLPEIYAAQHTLGLSLAVCDINSALFMATKPTRQGTLRSLCLCVCDVVIQVFVHARFVYLEQNARSGLRRCFVVPHMPPPRVRLLLRWPELCTNQDSAIIRM